MTVRGTHQGRLAGLVTTGEEMKVEASNIMTVKDGKIRVRGMSDQFRMMQQMGAIPS